MDIGRAFAFVFDDADWVKKILIGGLITLIPIIGGLVIYGYMLEIIRRVYAGSEQELPDWDDFGGYLLHGLLVLVGIFIWFLPVTLLLTCVMLVLILGSSSAGNDALVVFSSLFAFGIFAVLILLIMVWMVIVLPIIGGRYAVEQHFGAMFEFDAIMAEVRRAGFVPLLLLLVTYLAASTIGQLGAIACFVGVFFTSFYANVVVAHGAGQVYRKARGIDDVPAAAPRPAAF